MKITKLCPLTKQFNTIDINVTHYELHRINNRHATREYIQNIVPHLSDSEREFLMTGITDRTWQERFSGKEK